MLRAALHCGKSIIGAGIVLAALLCAAPARAQDALASASDPAEQLHAGQWLWTPEAAPSGPVVIYVDLSRQRVSVYRNGVRIGVSSTSTGRRGHETPAGVFTVLERHVTHHSNRYDNAPMPYMLRITWDGVALHAGAVRSRPASHGCIRLPLAFARELFRVAALGSTVVVAGEAGTPADGAGPGVLAPVEADGDIAVRAPLPGGQVFSWTPDASRAGPISVVLSLSDEYLVVLRNGVEIGRARASIPANAAPAEAQWRAVSAHSGDQVADLIDQVILPPAFKEALRGILTPGATLLVTRAAVTDDIGPAPPPAFSQTPPLDDTLHAPVSEAAP